MVTKKKKKSNRKQRQNFLKFLKVIYRLLEPITYRISLSDKHSEGGLYLNSQLCSILVPNILFLTVNCGSNQPTM